MSWSQVHCSNLPSTVTQEELEEALAAEIFVDPTNNCQWAGQGSTILKETRSGDTFCFLAFLTEQGALEAIDRLNYYNGRDARLCNWTAAMSNNNKKKGKSNGKSSQEADDNIRLRRKRTQPQRKHPIKNHSAPPKKS